MKRLHILKSEPDQTTLKLIQALEQDQEPILFRLYQDQDYDRLLELIFAHDEVVSWW
ncbi:MAG: hypothetical protein PVG03_01205 [Desulfarculaceae bacterium]|jgi:hypothetical protein